MAVNKIIIKIGDTCERINSHETTIIMPIVVGAYERSKYTLKK